MFTVGIITCSDRGFAGERRDESGPLISTLLPESAFRVDRYVILPDDIGEIKRELINMCDGLSLDLILTTGGTGFSPRDVTPEATLEIVERVAPGICEAIRYHSLQITPRAMLSRAAAGIRGQSLIINLPGSPKAVRESLEFITSTLIHGLEILKQESQNCARP